MGKNHEEHKVAETKAEIVVEETAEMMEETSVVTDSSVSNAKVKEEKMMETEDKKTEIEDVEIETVELENGSDEAVDEVPDISNIFGDDNAGDEGETEENDDTSRSVYKILEDEIKGMNVSESLKELRLKMLDEVKDKKVNVMLVGATGSGKSSTVNALFDMYIAKVGTGVDPETSVLQEFIIDNLTVWDTPGLGDGVERDVEIKNAIEDKLMEKDADGNMLVDLAVVVIDASTKDLGTYYELINETLKPAFGKEAKKRILIAVNQADIAMKGTHWDAEKNEPDDVLYEFLKNKAASVKERIMENTGLNIKPVCYCAGYKEEGQEQKKPYNLTKLLYAIIKAVPKDKRLAFADTINKDEDNWTFTDHESDYSSDTLDLFGSCIGNGIEEGAHAGGELGELLLGIPGYIAGTVLGGIFGGIGGLIEELVG